MAITGRCDVRNRLERVGQLATSRSESRETPAFCQLNGEEIRQEIARQLKTPRRAHSSGGGN
jgi:hypothetical protein